MVPLTRPTKSASTRPFTEPGRGVVQGLRPSRWVDSAIVQCRCRVLRQAEGTRARSSRIARTHPFAKSTGIREIQPNVADRVRCRQATQYRFMLAQERVGILNLASQVGPSAIAHVGREAEIVIRLAFATRAGFAFLVRLVRKEPSLAQELGKGRRGTRDVQYTHSVLLASSRPLHRLVRLRAILILGLPPGCPGSLPGS